MYVAGGVLQRLVWLRALQWTLRCGRIVLDGQGAEPHLASPNDLATPALEAWSAIKSREASAVQFLDRCRSAVAQKKYFSGPVLMICSAITVPQASIPVCTVTSTSRLASKHPRTNNVRRVLPVHCALLIYHSRLRACQGSHTLVQLSYSFHRFIACLSNFSS